MTYHLAPLNIGRMLAPIDDSVITEFVANLAPINALADNAPGFVRRLQSESYNATAYRPYVFSFCRNFESKEVAE